MVRERHRAFKFQNHIFGNFLKYGLGCSNKLDCSVTRKKKPTRACYSIRFQFVSGVAAAVVTLAMDVTVLGTSCFITGCL